MLREADKDITQALELLAAMLNEDHESGLDWDSPPLKGTVGWEIRQLAEKYRYNAHNLAALIAECEVLA